jgi:radical SAM superfamily enzyme YgiQ (UPF0313 family)
MKILLIKHPTTHFLKTAPPVSGIPLGLLYIASSLKKAGHDVQVYDAIVGADEGTWGVNCNDGIYRMGATMKEIKKVVDEINPDVVGISNQYSSQVENALKTAEAVKEVNRGIKVVMGGPHASVMPATFLDGYTAVDYVVMREGEFTMTKLIESIDGGRDIATVNGIAFVEEGKLVINEQREFIMNLDCLPLPAYELVDMERYFYFNEKGKDGRETYRYPGSERSVSMITSRGCPFNCIFCSIHLGMGRRFRAHSVDFVVNHIKYLKETYNIKHIHFEDDNFSFDISRFNSILDSMIKNNFNITWDTPNGVRADYLNEDILKKCAISGCTYLRIGVESANREVSEEIVRKHLDIDKVTEIARLCNKIGIDVEAFYIIGFPGEKIKQMKETIDFAVKQERLYGLYPYDMFTATPLIGTDLYKICQKKNYISMEISAQNLATATQGEGMIVTEDFTQEDIRGLLKDFRIRHHIARLIFSLKFFIRHHQYFIIRLKSRFHTRHLMRILKKFRLTAFIVDIFLFRYKNCILRKVGIE